MFGLYYKAYLRPIFLTVGWGFAGLIVIGLIGATATDFDEGKTNGFFTAGLLGGLAFGAWLGWGIPMRRRKLLGVLAKERGWTFSKGPNPVILPARGVPFSMKGRHHTRDLARAVVDGREFALMFHRVTTGHGRSQVDYDFTIIGVHVNADLPLTVAAPERGLHAIAAALGLQDLDTESAAFNRKWRVRAQDKKGALAILHPRTIERLLADDAGAFTITWDANAVYFARYGIKKSWADVDSILGLLAGLANEIPEYLKRERPEPGSKKVTA